MPPRIAEEVQERRAAPRGDNGEWVDERGRERRVIEVR